MTVVHVYILLVFLDVSCDIKLDINYKLYKRQICLILGCDPTGPPA